MGLNASTLTMCLPTLSIRLERQGKVPASGKQLPLNFWLQLPYVLPTACLPCASPPRPGALGSTPMMSATPPFADCAYTVWRHAVLGWVRRAADSISLAYGKKSKVYLCRDRGRRARGCVADVKQQELPGIEVSRWGQMRSGG